MTISKNKLKQMRKDKSLKLYKKLLRLEKKEAKNIFRNDLKKWYLIIDALTHKKLVVN